MSISLFIVNFQLMASLNRVTSQNMDVGEAGALLRRYVACINIEKTIGFCVALVSHNYATNLDCAELI